MSKKAQQQDTEKGFEGIEHALTRTEQFIEDNSKVLTYVILGIIAVVLIYMGVRRYYINPLEEEAAEQMFIAEKFFDRDSFELALYGYGTYPGFLEVIDDYGITKSANLAEYYAGISFYNLGEYNNAIQHLEDFNTDDILLGSAKYSSLGDAYVEMENYDAAITEYKKAIDKYRNDFSTPIVLKKLGFVYEESGEFENAAEAYRDIRDNYPETPEGRDIEKFIARAEYRAKNS